MMRCLLFLLFILALTGCNQTPKSTACNPLGPDNKTMLTLDHGYTSYVSIETARQCSEQSGRPILLIFSCMSCASGANLPWRMLKTEEVKRLVEENFLLVPLYIDDETPLPEHEAKGVDHTGAPITTIGARNVHFRHKYFPNFDEPSFALIDHRMEQVSPPIGFLHQQEKFVAFLKSGVKPPKVTEQ